MINTSSGKNISKGNKTDKIGSDCLHTIIFAPGNIRAARSMGGVYDVIKLKPSNLSGGTVYLLHPSVSYIEGFVLACE